MARFATGFTTRASCLLAAGLTALGSGLILGVVDLVRAGALAVAVPLAAAAAVFRTRVRIAHRRTADPLRATCGDAVTAHVTISNRSVIPTGTLLLEDTLPQQVSGHARFSIPGLASREERTVSYRMPALGRGRYRVGPLRIRLTDPFHMIDAERSFSTATDFLVLPAVERLPGGEPPRSYDVGENAGSHSIGAHGADDASTREYRTGDDLRKIHWRSTARAGSLMVRLEERPWQGRATVLLDLRAGAHRSDQLAPADVDVRQRDSLEWAISAAASIGTHLMIAGREVGLVDGAGSEQRIIHDSPAHLLDHLAVVTATRQVDLSQGGAALRSSGRDSALIAICGLLDPSTLRVLSEAHPRASAIPAFAMLLDTPTWDSSVPTVSDQCTAPAAVLAASGWRVIVVRREDRVADAWHGLIRGASRAAFAMGAAR